VAVLACVVLWVVSSLGYAAVITVATRTRPADTGAVLGVIASVSMLPVVFGAPLLGALYAHTGRFTEAFALTAALPLAALVACRRLPGAAGRQGSGGASRSGDPAGAREDAASARTERRPGS
jgi:nitrate/nitrite transporter NarK